MKFRIYKDNTDNQLFVITENEKETIEKNTFEFIGLRNGIHPYNRKRINWIVKILKSKGIVLNVAEVPTISQMGSGIDSDEFTFENLFIPKGFNIKSEDDNTYILFQDTEIGRGWCCLIKNNEILLQEHRDIVLNELEKGDFIRAFGIDYKSETKIDLT